MAYLALVRHGESEWNKLGLWTGWTDVKLTPRGHEQARFAGEKLKKTQIKFDVAYTSKLIRSQQTLGEIEKVLGVTLPVTQNAALNERDYGNFDGMDKFKVEQEYGEELFQKWHRGWDYPLPHGETLKQVYERTAPYFKIQILPLLKQGKNVLVSAHGNSLRAIIKDLDHIPDHEIARLEIPTGGGFIYEFDTKGKIITKEIISVSSA